MRRWKQRPFEGFVVCQRLRHKHSGFPIHLTHVRSPASWSPLRKTIQEITTTGKGFFHLNNNFHSICFPNEKLKMSRKEKLQPQNCQTQTVLGPNSELPWGKKKKKIDFVSIFAKTLRKPTLICVTSVWLVGFNQKPKAKIVFTNQF